MTQYNITTEMQTAFDYAFHDYFERKSVAAKVMPWTTGQMSYNMKYYVPVRLPEPIVSKNFSTEKITEPQYTELSNPTAAISLDLQVQDTDVKIAAQTSGMAIDTAWARLAAQQMDLMICKQIIQGDDTTAMGGLLDKTGGTSTYNTVKWETVQGVPNAISDVINTSTCLWPQGVTPPYELLLGHNLYKGWFGLIAATPVTDITQGDVALNLLNGNKSGDTSNLYWLEQTPASPVANVIYPLPAPSAQDGRFIIMKPVQDGTIAIQGVWLEPLHTTDWEFDTYVDRWHCKIKAMIGLQVTQTTAIGDHSAVDLA